MNRLQVISILCMALQILTPASAASIPLGEPQRVGILRLGKEPNTKNASSYRLLEQRLRRWLENDPQLSLEVRPIEGTLSEREAELRQGARRLQELTFQLQALVLRSDEEATARIPELRREMSPLIEQATAGGEGGAILQNAWVALALVDSRSGRGGDARKALRAAVHLHPKGELKDALPWEWESAPGVGDFLDAARREEKALVRSCALHLDIQPSVSEVFVNGFPIGRSRDLMLVPGDRYEVRVSAVGFDSMAQSVNCAVTGRQSAKLMLARRKSGGLPDPAQLRRLSESQGVGSLVLVASAQDRYRLYLYTPGVAIDELPTRRPLTARELQRDNSLPIVPERFNELLGKHRLAPLQLAMERDSISVPGASARWDVGRTEIAEAAPARWYNSGTFWAIAGTITAGAIVAFLATRGNSPRGGVSYSINNGR